MCVDQQWNMENGLTTMIADIVVITELMKIRICDCSERDGDIEINDNSEKSYRNCKNDNDNSKKNSNTIMFDERYWTKCKARPQPARLDVDGISNRHTEIINIYRQTYIYE